MANLPFLLEIGCEEIPDWMIPGALESLAQLITGVPYAREVGVEHNVVNANDFEFVFIELELL